MEDIFKRSNKLKRFPTKSEKERNEKEREKDGEEKEDKAEEEEEEKEDKAKGEKAENASGLILEEIRGIRREMGNQEAGKRRNQETRREYK